MASCPCSSSHWTSCFAINGPPHGRGRFRASLTVQLFVSEELLLIFLVVAVLTLVALAAVHRAAVWDERLRVIYAAVSAAIVFVVLCAYPLSLAVRRPGPGSPVLRSQSNNAAYSSDTLSLITTSGAVDEFWVVEPDLRPLHCRSSELRSRRTWESRCCSSCSQRRSCCGEQLHAHLFTRCDRCLCACDQGPGAHVQRAPTGPAAAEVASSPSCRWWETSSRRRATPSACGFRLRRLRRRPRPFEDLVQGPR